MASTTAIIADIHANLEALTAVLADISAINIDRIVCLGDIVGYGPNPCECVDLAMDFAVCVAGNHDRLALKDQDAESEAQRHVLWTRRQLGLTSGGANDADRRQKFLRDLPLTYRENGTLFVRGGPRDPLNEYLLPELVFDQRRMEDNFSSVIDCCFVGHTHLPGIFTSDCEFFTPGEIDGEWHLTPGAKTICNVGSVGQPRDDDCRACYCLFDGHTITFRQIAYDFGTTARKLQDLFPPQ